MRFMIIVKANKQSEAGVMPTEELMVPMAEYHEELMKAGVLVDGSGLHPSSAGWRIVYEGDNRRVVDGPFAETKELIAGYTIIDTKTREEAREWSTKFPNPMNEDCHIEVRRMIELDDLEPSPTIERFREMEKGASR